MKCWDVMEAIPFYLDGLLSPAQEQELRHHLESCPECADWLDEAREMRELWTGLENRPDAFEPGAVPDLVAGVLEEIGRLKTERHSRAEETPAVPKRSIRRASWLHYALAACLAFTLMQFGVFEQLGYGLTTFSGQMSDSVVQLFGDAGTR
ncbi:MULTISPECIES: zf-HC2 domain-containing protein [Paenibacillus]|nr:MULTISPECIES: zf-HC2 domain-containing protein [Paenibacillus]